MTIIIDRRSSTENKSAPNRKKFIERHRAEIQKRVEEIARDIDIKGFNKVKPGTRKIKIKSSDEPTFSIKGGSGTTERVIPRNKTFSRGDVFRIGEKKEEGSGDGKSLDEFFFTLSTEEFMNMYFGNRALPNFVKLALKGEKEVKLVRAGYTPDGPYSRLDLKKSFEQSIARRAAFKNSESKVPFLDDSDLRFRRYSQIKVPKRSATVFFLMDVSGSMDETRKTLAKKFYLLLYLFLTTKYSAVNIRFIRYFEKAEEVDEHTFFHDRKTGGTEVLPALELVSHEVSKLDTETENLYVCHINDGDSGYHETPDQIFSILSELSEKCQYLMNIQVKSLDAREIYSAYRRASKLYSNVRTAFLPGDRQLFKVFDGFFRKGE